MAQTTGGVWRTVGGRRIFIKDGEDLATAMKNSGKFNSNKPNEERYIDFIVDTIETDIEEKFDTKEERYEINTFSKYLNAMGYDSSKDFKEDIIWSINDMSNKMFKEYEKEGLSYDEIIKKMKSNSNYFEVMDDGSIEGENYKITSYGSITKEAKKRVKYFNKYLDEDE